MAAPDIKFAWYEQHITWAPLPPTAPHSFNALPSVTVCQYGIRATFEGSATWVTFNVRPENSVGLKSFEKSSWRLQFKQCLRKILNKTVTMWKLYLLMFVSHRDNHWTVWDRRVKAGVEIHHNYKYKFCAQFCYFMKFLKKTKHWTRVFECDFIA